MNRLVRTGRHRRRWISVAAAVTALILGLAGVLLAKDWNGGGPPSPSSTAHRTDAEAARQLLQGIPVQGRAAKTGYRRALYGHGWPTVAGCDMRNRILSRDLVDVVYRPGTHGCMVQSGTLHDPYTGKTVEFVKGDTTSSIVQIDHRYPLALSWQQGAQQWNETKRELFAADPANLIAVEGAVNESKGASGPGSWLPPDRSYRCAYVINFVTVAARYELSLNPGDHQAAERVLQRC